MAWIILVIGLLACAAFCWHILREDRRAVEARRVHRERLRLVTGEQEPPNAPDAADGAGTDEVLRDAA